MSDDADNERWCPSCEDYVEGNPCPVCDRDTERLCEGCCGLIPDDRASALCEACVEHELRRALAQRYDLSLCPDPSGERYLFPADEQATGFKKSERTDFFEDLWRALVKADTERQAAEQLARLQQDKIEALATDLRETKAGLPSWDDA